MRIQHQALCPEVDPLTCAEQDIPVHLHDQHITWFRLDPSLTTGLGHDLQLTVGLPFDLRVVRVDYYTLDGAVYEPPYQDIHHRNETLAGLTDGSVALRWYGLSRPDWTIGLGVGTSVPVGRTEEDPFALTEQGLTHQHIQLGAGTFIPTADLSVLYSRARWSGWFSASGRMPLYESKKGYLAPRSLNVSVGPGFRPTPTLQVLATADLFAESAEHWHGDPYGGRVGVGGSVSGLWTLSPRLVLQAQGRATAHQWNAVHHATAEEEGSYVQRFVGMVGLSWTFGKDKEEDEAP